ncbi:hypothetical protein JCM16303_002266 [Sporobolomyces ruberrimus]
MDPEFAIAPPDETPAAGEGEQRLSNKEKRKLKQLEKQQQQEQQAAAERAMEAPPVPLEETPLSHKEKRQAKKRRLAMEAAGEDPDAVPPPTKSSSGGGSAPAPTMIGGTAVGNTPARSAHGVWVGNMNFATHARDLLAWFQARGLADITRINMPNGKRSHENNRGFAYLDFPTQTDVVVAVGLSEQNLDGRKLLIKASTDYTGRPAAPALAALPPLDPSALEPSEPSTSAVPTGTGTSAPPQTLNRTARKILNRQKNPAGPTLFIGNLGFETVVDDIREMFDRNQKRSREWEKKTKEDKKKKKSSSKGKKKREEGQDSEEEESEAESEEGEEEPGSESEEESDAEEAEDDNEEEEEEDADLTEKKPRKDKQKKKEKGPLDLTKAETAGIRKIRLGTFEDTGKCKGWAFVDFHLSPQATRALLNLHNHTLNGRSLNVEYASAEAVRRGGLGSRAASKANGAARARGGDDDDGDRLSRGGARGGDGKRKGRDWDDSDMAGAAADAASNSFYDGPPAARRAPRGDGFGERPRREERPGKGGKGGERAKPGAALAMAQRASEAIVQSTGRKTTFE